MHLYQKLLVTIPSTFLRIKKIQRDIIQGYCDRHFFDSECKNYEDTAGISTVHPIQCDYRRGKKQPDAGQYVLLLYKVK